MHVRGLVDNAEHTVNYLVRALTGSAGAPHGPMTVVLARLVAYHGSRRRRGPGVVVARRRRMLVTVGGSPCETRAGHRPGPPDRRRSRFPLVDSPSGRASCGRSRMFMQAGSSGWRLAARGATEL
jgi:hypothetical protein